MQESSDFQFPGAHKIHVDASRTEGEGPCSRSLNIAPLSQFIYDPAYNFRPFKLGGRMSGLVLLSRPASRYLLSVILCAHIVVAQGGQLRSTADRVYSAPQAGRGQQLYNAQCAGCHGKALEGTTGPPLAGDDFLTNWSASPLNGLVDKIQKTMPFNQPGSLSRQQSIDLASFILQS